MISIKQVFEEYSQHLKGFDQHQHLQLIVEVIVSDFKLDIH